VRIILIIICLMMTQNTFPQKDKYVSAREDMVQTQIIARGISDGAVIKAMKKVPRHLFVNKEDEKDAYGDFPLSIGLGQTISQPYIVAYMTEAVNPSGKKKALEIGTGSGYQAAVLAEIVDSVYTIEIVPELAEKSAQRLRSMKYENVICKSGDGYHGWTEHAPFDIIVVTAAAEEIPEPLTEQLAEDGRLIIPVGSQNKIQELYLLVKKHGKIKKRDSLL
jgi:protein-L-isoaspartate(D-aspartate) O-methyltransferase